MIYKERDDSFHDEIELTAVIPQPPPLPPLIMTIPAGFDITTEEDGYMAEVQHIYRSEFVNIVSGAGHFFSNFDEIKTVAPSLPEFEAEDILHTNIYGYSQIKYPKNVTWTIGGSANFFEGLNGIDEDQINPKFGLTWQPLSDTTLRAAIFRVLTKPFLIAQTIELTQVAGFNQYFDDAQGTDSWRYGAALDQKFSDHLYFGAEFSKRDLEVPFTSIVVPPTPAPPPGPPPPGPPPAPPQPIITIERVDWDEYFGRAYIYFTPNRYVALSAGY